MPCNVINNPSFEAGIESWTPNGFAAVIASPVAYDGNNVLSLETAPSAPTVSVTQELYWLDTANVHNLTVQVRVEGEIPTTSHCEVRAYLGEDPEAGEFASDIIWNGGEWIQLEGSFQPTVRDTTISLVGYCTFNVADAEHIRVYFDDVIVSDC
ncbi:hypothetical protein BJX63DRAFT_379690 [Aspergillus granulosus]|uniref:CBM-cenC domain-containing protein n=1 Tax=Aspergillus granulosus TaxID=176169 RepID=A0ABR4I0G2_9EURO